MIFKTMWQKLLAISHYSSIGGFVIGSIYGVVSYSNDVEKNIKESNNSKQLKNININQFSNSVLFNTIKFGVIGGSTGRFIPLIAIISPLYLFCYTLDHKLINDFNKKMKMLVKKN